MTLSDGSEADIVEWLDEDGEPIDISAATHCLFRHDGKLYVAKLCDHQETVH